MRFRIYISFISVILAIFSYISEVHFTLKCPYEGSQPILSTKLKNK